MCSLNEKAFPNVLFRILCNYISFRYTAVTSETIRLLMETCFDVRILSSGQLDIMRQTFYYGKLYT
jgi:hypothetical protein